MAEISVPEQRNPEEAPVQVHRPAEKEEKFYSKFDVAEILRVSPYVKLI